MRVIKQVFRESLSLSLFFPSPHSNNSLWIFTKYQLPSLSFVLFLSSSSLEKKSLLMLSLCLDVMHRPGLCSRCTVPSLVNISHGWKSEQTPGLSLERKDISSFNPGHPISILTSQAKGLTRDTLIVAVQSPVVHPHPPPQQSSAHFFFIFTFQHD